MLHQSRTRNASSQSAASNSLFRRDWVIRFSPCPFLSPAPHPNPVLVLPRTVCPFSFISVFRASASPFSFFFLPGRRLPCVVLFRFLLGACDLRCCHWFPSAPFPPAAAEAVDASVSCVTLCRTGGGGCSEFRTHNSGQRDGDRMGLKHTLPAAFVAAVLLFPHLFLPHYSFLTRLGETC